MRIFISTGEVSGDLQGGLLVEALSRKANYLGVDLEIVALGGDRMEAAGAKILGKTTRLGSMGIVEGLPFVLPTLKIQSRAKQFLRENPPDLLILLDYLAPNISIGSFVAKTLPDVPIVYYIAPQAWIWSATEQKRLGKMVDRLFSTKKLIEISDHLLAIFQEEAHYYSSRGLPVTWVGHPLLDRMKSAPTREEARHKFGLSADTKVIALFPASRQQELKYLVPLVCQVGRQIQNQLGDVHFLVPVPLTAYRTKIESLIEEYGLKATVLEGARTLEAMAAADLAIAKSGTVNLEIALLDVPQVVVYRLSALSAWIARRIMRFSIPFVSPVNLVLKREIVPELLQESANPDFIVQESLDVLLNTQRRIKMRAGYREMRENLGEAGVCDRVAEAIFSKFLS
ncbi:MAG: Lipid-A-disaccharide synthase [Chroococcopsis gigantea SAG 12.99]|jgi:lipid-A-disaccharide synthase|nr:lipid-A-disaccharide synthase [Chlorogloea purpurea SAG 13.99]MDV2999799.1 Lipid-A-disaccharide synthase [Chroococcopsis gigantea SAG 12.99]